MEKIKIEKTFEMEYLTCGNTRDNFIFENCPIEFIQQAEKLLGQSAYKVKSCNVKLTRDDEILYEQTLKSCQTEAQIKILSRDLILALVMKEILRAEDERVEDFNLTCKQINAFKENNFTLIKELHPLCFMQYELADAIKEVGKFEINLFLVDTENIDLQKAINNLIISREPYSIKLFTNLTRLPTYRDQAGNFMQSPHDYINMNVNNFISYDNCDLISD